MTTSTNKIQTVAFGDKSAIARTLTTKGAELKASILEGALLPMLSNYLAGHSTFKGLVSGGKHNEHCPLQSAVFALKGKAKQARDAAFALKTLASDQGHHDDLIAQATLAIAAALAPVARTAPTGPTVSEKLATCESELANVKAERDALRAVLETLKAQGVTVPQGLEPAPL